MRYSTSARDYLYLGPVETNRQGSRDYYLWVGVATTLDRGYLAQPLALPDTLYLQVGDELMELRLLPWGEREPGLQRVDLYDTAVALEAELAARVTLSQLMLLADQPLRSIRAATAGGNSRVS